MPTHEQKSFKAFLLIWSGQIVSLLGSSLVGFALVWYLTEQTESAVVLAAAAAVAMLPQILLGPFAGALVDRWNRRIMMITADSVSAVATLVVALLYAFDVIQIWHIYVLMFIRSVAGAFHWPAMQATTPLMVPERHLARVSGLNQSLFGLAGIIAPPVGALLLEVLPMEGIIAIEVVTAMFAIAPLFFVAVPNPVRARATNDAGASVLVDVRAGLRLVLRWPGLLFVFGVAMFLNLMTVPAFSLSPIMITKTFNGGAVELGWTQAAWGAGMLIGGVLMGVWGGFKRRMVTAMFGMILGGVGMLIVGFAPPTMLGWVMVGLLVGGTMNTVINASAFAALQATAPADMQGRIFTLLMSGSSLIAPLGLGIAGPLAEVWGVQVWFTAAGVLMVGIGLVSCLFPFVIRFEEEGARVIAKLVLNREKELVAETVQA
ncbi:MAG: MFS transporter [Anaerolineales bacterium]